MHTLAKLVDEAATAALEHATALERELRRSGAASEADAHRLVSDIVTLRNAAELLKRQALAAA